MGGDYTRFTFDPRFDYAAVLSQQGRLQLDADWNELVDVLDRRWRAETVDLIGRSGVPANAPNGFSLTWQGTNDLRIGRGRMYVDGLIAENHGSGTTEYEPIWDEPQGSTEYVLWSQQPYEPQWRLRPPVPTGTGPHLVYLDVWRRERTAADVDGLVDQALGVDTDTRVQTVWQVRFVPNAGAGVKCSTDWDTIAGYRDATRLSGARLTTVGQGVTQPDDPCFVSPTGGYRGRENRLYRVEVHDDGTISGNPTFKWSRDNGSVATRIISITDPTGTNPRLQVARIGRDAILSFHVNDWVEVLDDALELDGVPGILAQVDQTEDATNTIWLKNVQAGSSTANLTDTSAGRNARLRRWDGTDAHGAAEITAAAVELEDGVFVTFNLTAGAPRVRDWWSFAARSITGDVEHLDNAPPRGVRHHYAPLGILRGPNVKPDDCRTFFPVAPDACCDCDVCVNPVDNNNGTHTIQMAIDKVKVTGGKVCLQVGIYELRQPLRIQGAHSVQLVGKGIRTVLMYEGGGPAIDVESSQEVTIERLAVVTSTAGIGKLVASGGKTLGKPSAGPQLGILVAKSEAVTIERCLIVQGTPFYSPGASDALSMRRSPVFGGVGIGLAGMLAGISIRHNLIFAEVGVASMAVGAAMTSSADQPNVWETQSRTDERLIKLTGKQQWQKKLPRYLVTLGLVIDQNMFGCWRSGVDLVRFAGAVFTTAIVMHEGEARVAQNTVLGCSQLGIAMGGITAQDSFGSGSSKSWFGSAASSTTTSAIGAEATYLGTVFSRASRVDILSNVLAVRGVGIAAGSNATRIAGNEVSVLVTGDERTGFEEGILIFPNFFVRSIGELQVDGNRVHDAPRYGILLEARVESALIKRNQIARAGLGGIAIGHAGIAVAVVVEDNQILDTAPNIDERDSVPTGIEIMRCGEVTVARNEIVGVGPNSFSAQLRGGIHAVACQSIRIAENDVRDVGPFSDFGGAAVGIHVEGPYERVDVNENTVLTPDYGSDGLPTGASIGVLVGRGLSHPIFEKEIKIGDEVIIEEGPDAQTVDELGKNVVRMAMLSASSSTRAEHASPILVRETDGIVHIVGPDAVTSVRDDGADVAVRGNLLQGAGQAAALLVRTPGDCLASDNRCSLSTAEALRGIAWIEATNGAIVSSNRVEGTSRESIFILVPQVKPPPATVLGNITSGLIRLNYAALPTPWAPLNVRR